MDRARNSHDAGGGREIPDTFALGFGDMGSFDCVAIRFADGNYAQDDRVFGEVQ